MLRKKWYKMVGYGDVTYRFSGKYFLETMEMIGVTPRKVRNFVNHLGINSEACISSRVKRLVVITSQALLPKGYIIGQLTDARLIAKI